MHDTFRGAPSRPAAVAHFLKTEFLHVLPPTLFFAAGFVLIVFTERLMLAQYSIPFVGYAVPILAALVVGKAVLVADKMPFLSRFDNAPLIQPILFKTVVYWAFVFIARLLEAFVHYVLEEGRIGGFAAHMIERFSWNQFLFVQVWILVLFLIYTTAAELNGLVGDGQLFRIFFRYRSNELKQTRRQRIRTLVRLSRLTEQAARETLRDPSTAAHREMVRLVEALADGSSGPERRSGPRH